MKYLTVIISAVLILATLFLLPASIPTSLAGAGNGSDRQVEKLSELSRVFDLLNGEDSDTASEKTDLLSLKDISSLSSNSSSKKSSKSCKSVTMHNESFAKSDYYRSTSSIQSRGSSTLNRSLWLYMTEDEAYYHSVGSIVSFSSVTDYSTPGKKISTRAEFDVEIYIEDRDMYIKFNEFWMVGNNIVRLESDAKGRWIDASEVKSLSGFMGMDLTNRALLSRIGRYIDENKDDSFSKSGDLYVLSDEYLDECMYSILGVNLPDNKWNGGFSVDLNDKKAPSLLIECDYSDHESSDSSSFFTRDNIRFENIDNTVINFPSDVDFFDAEDIEDIFIMEEGQNE